MSPDLVGQSRVDAVETRGTEPLPGRQTWAGSRSDARGPARCSSAPQGLQACSHIEKMKSVNGQRAWLTNGGETTYPSV
jgi:hypothetical protein